MATADDVFGGFLRARAARGVAASTLAQYGMRTTRILKSFRKLHHIPDKVAVPGTHLTREGAVAVTREGAVAVTNHLRAEGLADGSIYGCMKTFLAAWTWASDDPAEYPGIATAPRDPSAVLPHAPIYTAAPAPTLDEVDAVIGWLASWPRSKKAYAVAVVMRFTGAQRRGRGPVGGDADDPHGQVAAREGRAADHPDVEAPAGLPRAVRGRARGGRARDDAANRPERGRHRAGRHADEGLGEGDQGGRRAPRGVRAGQPEERAARSRVPGGIPTLARDGGRPRRGDRRAGRPREHSARFEAMRTAVDALPLVKAPTNAKKPSVDNDGANVVAFKAR